MLQLRIREFTPAGVRGKKIITVKDSISVTDLENGAASLSFAVSTASVGRFTHDEFVVGVEYSLGGEFWALTRNDLFLVSANNGDDADTSKTVTYTGETYAYAMLPKHWVIGGPNAKDGKMHYTRGGAITNAGDIAKWELDESRAAGWAPQIGYTFTYLKDSNGVNWEVADRQQISISVPVNQERLISALVGQGMCGVETSGTELRLLRPGTTRDRRNVVLGGPAFTRIPVKVNAKDQYTRLHVVMDGGREPIFHVPVPGADTRFGTVDALITLSGVTDRATAEKIATQRAVEGAAVQREESYEWTPTINGFVPWRDFHVSDTVTARARGGKIPRRVIGLVVREQNGTVTARAIVGDHVASSALKSLRKLSSVSVGGMVGGSGESFLHPPLPPTQPTKPAGLHVTNNEGSWGEDGTARTTVTLEWAPVTSDVAGQEITVTTYEIWSRLPSGQLARDTAVPGPTASINSWVPGEDRIVVVYAISAQGVKSEPSLELLVTPGVPSSIVPAAPGALTVVSNVGAFTVAGPVATVSITIPAVTLSTDGALLSIAEYELWDAHGPVLRVPASPAVLSLTSGLTEEFRARALSTLGVWGDLSAPLEVTGATPGTAARAPSPPVLATGYGNVPARWDGTYTGGGTSGAHTAWVEARIAEKLDPPTPATAWARQGAALIGPGSALIRLGEVDDTLDVRVIAYDQLGRETGISEVVSIKIVTIPGASITAGSIKVDQLEPNIGDTLNLGGNAISINLNSRIDDANHQITQTKQNVDVVLADTAAAAAAAAEANQAVESLAAGRVLSAEAALAVLSGKIDNYENSFLFLPDGLHIRESTSAKAEMVLTSAGARLMADGVTASEWNQGQLIVDQIVANGGRIGNHALDASIAGHTIWRAI